MKEKLRVLVTAGHPADALDGVGGTIAKHTDQGDWVGVAVLTHGVKSHSWYLMAEERKKKAASTEEEVAEQKEIKEREIRDGLDILGMAAAFPLHPVLLPAARPEMRLARSNGFQQRLFVHVRHHDDRTRFLVDNHRGNQSRAIVCERLDGFFQLVHILLPVSFTH